MREFLILFKMQLNVNLGFSALGYRFRKEQDKIPQTLLLFAGLAILIGGLVSGYSLLMGAVYAAGKAAGRPEIALMMAILGLQVFLLITGIFYVIGVFYYSKDLSALVPLPVKPWHVLGSKFAVVMVYEYLMALPILLPPIVIYGVGQAEGPLYWLKALLVLLASPVLPMTASSLIAILLMRIINIGKRKDLFAIIGGFVTIFLIIGFNLLTQSFAGSAANDPDALARLLADRAQFMNSIGSAFPPSAWATLALAQSGAGAALNLLLFLGLSAALVFALLWLADATYYRSALQSAEVNRGAKKPAANGGAAVLGNSAGPVRSLFMKEMKLLLRTPAYVMNCLAGSLIIPIIMPISMLQGEESTSGIRALITNPNNGLFVTLGAVALMMLVSIVNVTASTALSREGRTFWVSRMIPVRPSQQVYAKFLAAMAVACVGLILTAVMLVAILGMNPYRAVMALILGLLGSIPVTVVNMIPDIIKPKLSWTNPYEAVKQNMNVLLSMLAACVVVGVEAAITVVMVLVGLPEWVVYTVLAVLMIGQSLAGAKVLALASGRYYRIEV